MNTADRLNTLLNPQAKSDCCSSTIEREVYGQRRTAWLWCAQCKRLICHVNYTQTETEDFEP